MASVRRAQPDDSARIARLHREIISWGLLTKLGDPVVTGFYRAVTSSPVAFCFVGEEAGRLDGFAAGVTDWPRFLRDVARSVWWPLLRGLSGLLIRGRWRRLLETERYTQSGHEGVRAEFLSLGVRKEATARLWVGTALVRAVVNEFRRRGVSRIRGVVWAENERALRFFEAVGFRFVSQVEIHPGEVSRTFVVDLVPGTEGV
ncbi:MAG TPA: GNAT family N-acetyltransferase [bacterium]|nr:GNAT family N-acetyltransferase [bacterium]